MPVFRDFSGISDKCLLLWDGKGASFGRIHIMRPLTFAHHTIGRVDFDIEVVNRKVK